MVTNKDKEKRMRWIKKRKIIKLNTIITKPKVNYIIHTVCNFL